MKIFTVWWDRDGFGLSAVVIAGNEKEAVGLLELNDECDELMNVSEVVLDGPRVLCREEL